MARTIGLMKARNREEFEKEQRRRRKCAGQHEGSDKKRHRPQKRQSGKTVAQDFREKTRIQSRKGMRLSKWNETVMENAINEFNTCVLNEGTACLRSIARAWGVPKSTLERRVKNKVSGHCHASGRPTALGKGAEDELAELACSLAARGFPLSEKQLRDLATQFANKNGLMVFSANKNNRAGFVWMRGFLERHPNLKVKRAEGLSAARAQAMNKPNIMQWFDKYEKLLQDLNITDLPSHIWNLDECGVQDAFDSKRAIGVTGQPLYQVKAGEKGDTTTVLPVFNAMGSVAALMIIFKGIRLKSECGVGAPAGTMIRGSKDGWINKELFYQFGKKFVESVVQDGKKHVLLLDGHGSHVYNLDFINLMKDNNIELFCFPPHSSHVLQPADRSVFKSFKSHWTTEGLKFTKNTGGQKLGKYKFF